MGLLHVAITTTASRRIRSNRYHFYFIFFLFYFTNKYCYSSMYMQRCRRCRTHQHHLIWRPSTTTATSQPTQPPWVVGFFLFLFSCFFFILINIAIVLCTCNDDYDGWPINTNHLTPQPSTMTAMSWPRQPPCTCDDNDNVWSSITTTLHCDHQRRRPCHSQHNHLDQ